MGLRGDRRLNSTSLLSQSQYLTVVVSLQGRNVAMHLALLFWNIALTIDVCGSAVPCVSRCRFPCTFAKYIYELWPFLAKADCFEILQFRQGLSPSSIIPAQTASSLMSLACPGRLI